MAWRVTAILTVTFWLSITVPDQHPVVFESSIESIDACLEEARRFLMRPPHAIQLSGGKVDAGCVVEIAPAQEH